MISTCAGIGKYAFYLDFKGVLSSKPQVSVLILGKISQICLQKREKKTKMQIQFLGKTA
jgi:hypothetical protein